MSDIAPVFLTKAWLFQAIIAGPTFAVLGFCAMLAMWDGTYWSIYDFVTLLCTATMAGGIIFVAIVQRQLARDGASAALGRWWALRLEAVKCLLATGLWVWLMADALWGPGRSYYSPVGRQRRLICSAVSVNLLFIFFYPTTFYIYFTRDRNEGGLESREGSGQTGGNVGERTPLLGAQEHTV